jgi:hypothetical protein
VSDLVLEVTGVLPSAVRGYLQARHACGGERLANAAPLGQGQADSRRLLDDPKR